jgi:hypothetical protein
VDSFFRIELRRVSRSGAGDAEGFRAYLRGTVISAAAYRRGEKGQTDVEGRRRRFDYRRKRGIAHTETFAPEGAAEFALVSESLWQEVERVEKRKDALLAYELLVSLPRDIHLEQCLKHLRRWILAECVAKGMIADLAVHTYGTALDPEVEEQAAIIDEVRSSGIPMYPLEEGDLLRHMPPDHHHAYELTNGQLLVYQPHAHILLTTREIGPEDFGLKVKAWGQKAQLFRWRQSWAEVCNNLLAEAGRPERVTAKGKKHQKAEAEKRSERLWKSGPISRTMLRTIDIRGGHWAALEGRPPRHIDETAPMTKYSFNDQVRDLHKGWAALQAAREAAEREQEDLVDAIARVQALTDQGVDLNFDDEAETLIADPPSHLTETDARLLGRHRKILARIMAAAPGKAPQVDEALAEAMAVIDALQRDHRVTFYRTAKGSLGFKPEGAVPPEIYRRFAGMHESILGELGRREYAELWKKGKARLHEQKEQLKAAAQECQQLQRSLATEQEARRHIEQGASALIESARTGKVLPEADAGSLLLRRLRGLVIGYRKRITEEKERAEKAERAVKVLEETVATLWQGVDRLVRGVAAVCSWVIHKRPELRSSLNDEVRPIFADLPEMVREGVTIPKYPGVRPEELMPARGQPRPDRSRDISARRCPEVGNTAPPSLDGPRSDDRSALVSPAAPPGGRPDQRTQSPNGQPER